MTRRSSPGDANQATADPQYFSPTGTGPLVGFTGPDLTPVFLTQAESTTANG